MSNKMYIPDYKLFLQRIRKLENIEDEEYIPGRELLRDTPLEVKYILSLRKETQELIKLGLY